MQKQFVKYYQSHAELLNPLVIKLCETHYPNHKNLLPELKAALFNVTLPNFDITSSNFELCQAIMTSNAREMMVTIKRIYSPLLDDLLPTKRAIQNLRESVKLHFMEM